MNVLIHKHANGGGCPQWFCHIFLTEPPKPMQGNAPRAAAASVVLVAKSQFWPAKTKWLSDRDKPPG